MLIRLSLHIYIYPAVDCVMDGNQRRYVLATSRAESANFEYVFNLIHLDPLTGLPTSGSSLNEPLSTRPFLPAWGRGWLRETKAV